MSNIFSKAANIYNLFKSIDFKQLEALSKKVDLQEVMTQFGKMDDKQLAGLMKMMKGGDKKKELPPIDADFYDLSGKLSPEDRELQMKVRQFMETEIKPIVNRYWNRAEFPFDIIP